LPKKDRTQETSSKDIPKPGEGETICVVKKMLGGDHLIVLCVDGKERLARIPGKIRKKMWMREGDVVLVGIWDFQPDRCDILYRYGNDEIKKLINENIVSKEIIEQLRG
jgi:translation initiation factor 1A